MRTSSAYPFYPCSARVDGLKKRELTATEMVEYFEGRDDYLHYRQTTYGKPVKKFEPAGKESKRHIQVRGKGWGRDTQITVSQCFPQRIVERFQHNPAVPANKDVAQRTFLLDQHRIQLVYHLEENRITASTREFVTPPLSGPHAQPLTYSPDMTSAYQVHTLLLPTPQSSSPSSFRWTLIARIPRVGSCLSCWRVWCKPRKGVWLQ